MKRTQTATNLGAEIFKRHTRTKSHKISDSSLDGRVSGTPVCPAGCFRDTWPVSRKFFLRLCAFLFPESDKQGGECWISENHGNHGLVCLFLFVFLPVFLHFSSVLFVFFFVFLLFSQGTRGNDCNLLQKWEFDSDPVCTDPVQNFLNGHEENHGNPGCKPWVPQTV